jgi:hypothetical protein
MAVTREEVIWCYRCILGREPESEAVVEAKLKHKNFAEMREVFLSSSEFINKQKNLPPRRSSKPLDVEKNEISRRVVVSSNCQTGGIAAALQVIFPNDVITPLALPPTFTTESELKFVEELKNTDVWVSIGGYDLPGKYGIADRLQLVKIPVIHFSAFHPDVVYARKISTNELTMPHYNSAIAVWAYKNGLQVSDAEKLFNKKTYNDLGYLDHWGPSIEELKQRFERSDLEFAEFILPMRREGLFMYSLNHPKVMALVRLAKLIARKMGAGVDVLDRYIDINDGLNDVIWPLYPEIGESLSLHSDYLWKMGPGWWIRGVRSYLEYAYKNYERLKIAPDDIAAVQINEQVYNQVLGAQAGITLE